MRRIATMAVGVVLTLGVGIPAASASTASVTQVIKVKAVQNSSSFHGNSFSFTESLWQGARKVGSDAVTCTFPSPSPTAVGHCTGVAIFPGSGDIFLTATTEATSNGAHGRLVGGTGVFTNARGTLLVVSPSQSSKVSWITLTYHI